MTKESINNKRLKLILTSVDPMNIKEYDIFVRDVYIKLLAEAKKMPPVKHSWEYVNPNDIMHMMKYGYNVPLSDIEYEDDLSGDDSSNEDDSGEENEPVGRRGRGGFIYMIQRPSYAKDVVKIGMTQDRTGSRINSYGKKAVILGLCTVKDARKAESLLKDKFNKEYKLVDGHEHFKGDLKKMQKTFDLIAGGYLLGLP